MSKGEPKGQIETVKHKTGCEWLLLVLFILGVIAVLAFMVYFGITAKSHGDESPTKINKEKNMVSDQKGKDPLVKKLRAVQKSLGNDLHAEIKSFSNWDKTTIVPQVVVVSPSSLDQIRKAVLAARGNGLKVRCVGSAHSYSNLFADEGQMIIETKELRTRHDGPPIELHRPIWGNSLLVVSAAVGLYQEDLVQFFVKNGVQIRATSHEMNALLGGIFSTGSRGESIRRGPVSDIIVAMRIVDSEGRLRSFNVFQHPEEMAMLRLCVGLCGVIYDITFRVEPLEVCRSTNTFPSLADVVFNTTHLRQLHNKYMLVMHWSPLSSLTAAQWDEYDQTGTITQAYNPMNDLVWMRAMEAPVYGVVPDSRVIIGRDIPQTIPDNIPSGTLEGPIKRNYSYSVTSQPDMETTAAPTEPTPTADSGSEAENSTTATTISLRYHQFALEYTRALSPAESYGYLPEAIVLTDPDALDIIYSVSFDIPDDVNFTRTVQALQLTLSLLAEYAYRGQMPILTMMMKWIDKSPDCFLCPGNINLNNTEVAHIFALELIGSVVDPLYPKFVNEITSAWMKEFPDATPNWAKWYEFINGLQQQFRKGFGPSMTKFLELRKKADLDPDNIFTSEYLSGIFFPDK